MMPSIVFDAIEFTIAVDPRHFGTDPDTDSSGSADPCL